MRWTNFGLIVGDLFKFRVNAQSGLPRESFHCWNKRSPQSDFLMVCSSFKTLLDMLGL